MIKKIQQLSHIIRIKSILIRYRLDEIVLETHLLRPFRFFMYLNPYNWKKNNESRGVRIRKALEELGPVFVKFGQILSTRRDILPDDISIELIKLQDKVPHFPTEEAQACITKALNKNIDELFQSFDTEPLASASIAQVHAAVLPTGEEVVVKVVRPKIIKTIRRDISLMKTLAELAERYWSHGKRLKPITIVNDFEQTIIDELDLLRESANASQLQRNFKDYPYLKVPKIYWEYCARNVMVQERIYGIPIQKIDQLHEAKVDMKKLAERGVEIFFTQVFRDSFFHADMHAGNIFVDATSPDEPVYIAVDFGIMGTLGPDDQRYLAENLLAFFLRDYRKVAELHVESGWVPRDTKVDELEAAIRTVCEPIFEKPLYEISFGKMLLRLFQTARRFNMEVQPQLVLLQKTLLNIEGLGRQLYPKLDLWHTAKPFLEKWMKDRASPIKTLSILKKQSPYWVAKVPYWLEQISHRLDNPPNNLNQNSSMAPKSLSSNNDKQNKSQKSNNFISGLGFGLIVTAWFTQSENITILTGQDVSLSSLFLLLGGICIIYDKLK